MPFREQGLSYRKHCSSQILHTLIDVIKSIDIPAANSVPRTGIVAKSVSFLTRMHSIVPILRVDTNKADRADLNSLNLMKICS